MATKLRQWKNRRDFRRAAHQAKKNRQMTCGLVKPDGKPVYFVMPVDASDDQIDDRAFSLVHGRERTDAERLLARLARTRQAA